MAAFEKNGESKVKILSFSAVEILPSLLSRKKQSTIRLAWRLPRKYPVYVDGKRTALSDFVEGSEKPAWFKIGDKVTLMWHQRGTPKDAKFCSNCGKQTKKVLVGKRVIKFEDRIQTEQDYVICCPKGMGWYDVFPKILGTATITDVFQIEMQTDSEQGSVTDLTARAELGKHLIDVEKETRHHPSVLAERDGFKSAQEMFEWFNKKYGLEQPKKFWVYEFKWDSPLKKEK